MFMGKNALRTAALCAAALGLGLIAGRSGLGPHREEQGGQQEQAAEQPRAVSAGERFEVFTVNIFGCGHILERDEGRAVEGAEAEALLAELGGYTYELKDGRMALYREYEQCCPEHYYTGLGESGAAVYRTDEGTLQPALVCRLSLKEGDDAYEEMASGMVFSSLEEINLYLEGLDE